MKKQERVCNGKADFDLQKHKLININLPLFFYEDKKDIKERCQEINGNNRSY